MREEQRREARARVETLVAMGLHESVLADFDEGRVHYSERTTFGELTFGALFWVSGDDAIAEAVRGFEAENDALAYHVTHERTDFGELLDVYYVSCHEDEWGLDRDDLRHGTPFCYVINLSDPDLSEFGRVGIAVSGGGLVRVA